MGCAASKPKEDPATMLEKQREIMLARQREFEAKRKEAAPAAGGTPPTSQPSSAKSPNPNTPTVPAASRVVGATRVNSKPIAETAPNQQPASPASAPAAPAASPAPETTTAEPTIEDSLAVEEEKRAKYTIKEDDESAKSKRISRNAHDYSQFMGKTKDFARRASFQPDKPPVFTAEQIAELQGGSSSSKAEDSAPKQASPKEPEARMTVVEESPAENGRMTVVEDPVTGESRVTLVEDDKRPPAIETNVSGEPDASIEDRSAKFTAHSDVDRKSKNMHDLGAFMGKSRDFARRASYVPPP